MTVCVAIRMTGNEIVFSPSRQSGIDESRRSQSYYYFFLLEQGIISTGCGLPTESARISWMKKGSVI